METESQGPSSGSDIPLLPARMMNEFTYCPRLAYFEWVDGEFADNAETTEGRFHHRRVDQAPVRKTKQAEDEESVEITIHQRSVWLSSERLGVTAKIDVVEGETAAVVPVRPRLIHPGEGRLVSCESSSGRSMRGFLERGPQLLAAFEFFDAFDGDVK